jgi:hypothetical protein
MPTIKVNDNLGVEILSAAAGPGSGISKYFKGDVAGFVASSELALAFTKRIHTLTPDPLGFGLKFAADGTFGTSGVDWRIQAGSRVSVQVTQAGKAVPGERPFGRPFVVPADRAVVGTSFTPSLSAAISGSAGELQFGFSAGGSVEFTAARTFDTSNPGTAPVLADALKDLLETGVVPGNVLDVRQMNEGDIGSVSGSGSLSVSASFDVAKAFNPLAIATVPLKQIGTVKLDTGASLSVGASIGIRGRYQVRIYKLAGEIVRLGFYKMSGSQFQFDVKASIAASLAVGKKEMLATLMGMLGAPKADVTELVDAGLSDEQIDELKAAIEASLNRSIAISLAGSFAVQSETSSVFEYEFDLNNLGTDGVDALNRALQADLSPLTSRSSTDMPHGIRMLSSELAEVTKKSVTWKVNFLGLVNVLRVSELVRTGMALFNAESGELVVTDSVSAKKLSIVTFPMAADPKKLHKMMMQSLVITAAYRAAGTQPVSRNLSGSMMYFEQTANANRTTISNYLDNLMGCGLISAAEKTTFLGGSFRDRASVLLDAVFADDAFAAMFMDGAGDPRSQEHFDDIGRKCIAEIVQRGDEGDFRRIPMIVGDAASDKLWKDMTDAGQPSLHTVLPAGINSGVPLQILIHDYTVIRWWSNAMSKAAKEVQKMKAFLDANGRSAEALQTDPEFLKRRDKLNDALEDIASNALPDFLDAWGVLAMDAASNRKGVLRGILVTAGPVLVKQRP